MAYASYTARRAVVSYHTAEQDYSVSFDTSAIEPPSGDDLRTVQESISGAKETQFYGERLVWTITSIPIQRGSALDLLMLEFLRSTADGQSFAFDPYLAVAGGVSAFTATREDGGFARTPFKEIDGVSDYYTFSFKVREP